jgi:hypothetical protein
MSHHSSSSSFGDLLVYVMFTLLSVFTGAIVVMLLLVATAPLAAIYPAGSGAKEIIMAVATLWGVVVGCVVGVFTLGPWHRLRVRGQMDRYVDIAETPIELIGVAPRRPANARRPQREAVARVTQDNDVAGGEAAAQAAHATRRYARG